MTGDGEELSGTELQTALRADLLESLELELVGPEAADEVLTELPTLRYLMGRLAPAGTEVGAEEDEGAAEAGPDADESQDGAVAPPVLAMNPSSIGLSIVLEPDITDVLVSTGWGQYHEEQLERVEERTRPSTAEEPTAESDGPRGEAEAENDGSPRRTRKSYVREQLRHERELDVSHDGKEDLGTDIFLEWFVRRLDDGGGRLAVSIFLVNRREPSDPVRPAEDEWIFQPQLRVEGPQGRAVLAPRQLLGGKLVDDPDLRSAELVYWNLPEYAVGHNCAADWDPPLQRQAINAVWTSLLPSYELPRIDPREDSPGTLDMRALGGAGPEGLDGSTLAGMLSPLVDAYRVWIDELEDGLFAELSLQVGPELKKTAWDHLERCRIAADRIAEGIRLLQDDDVIRRAFCFANRAMALQRERSVIALARRRGSEPPFPHKVRAVWRPFQIAFILLNLAGVAQRGHRDRDVADLLWFPTGGGKTEAYLGLTAFTLAYRRTRAALEGFRTDAGVSVLMRYTLRLLTLQQFQRATALICACDHLRRKEGVVWGGQPFSIGLWVGQSATPNAYRGPDGAKEALQRSKEKLPVRRGSPIQLVSCPWCGSELTPDNYRSDDEREQVFVTCSDTDCEYSPTGSLRGLPIHVVDEEVYRHTPSLVIATVDKFARIPWKGHVQALFGRIDRHCARHGFLSPAENHSASHQGSSAAPAVTVDGSPPLEPPDLIIQDELHLISGPLGTLVGVYESAVDLLASARIDGAFVRPKVIASTATIRRADAQVLGLFDRSVQVFPPQGLDARDSWFGKEVPVSQENPGRLYTGIYAPGKSVKTALVRVYAALLSRAQQLLEDVGEPADPYMTLVGYFNSLRELGGALRLVEDDIPGRMRVLNKRDPDRWSSRFLYEREELTSNKKAEQVPAILAKLDRVFTGEKPEPGQYPVDTVLASNMISVGVDIDRLGLMVVNGQPKTTAEYIQATSRVGRQFPGIVPTVYNWTRPRDISHYERFRSYHQMLYRFVEPTSVTPFSSRARDRALDGVLAGLVRLGDTRLTREPGADLFDPSDPWVREVIDWISARAENVSLDGGTGDIEAETRAELLQRTDRWANAAADHDLRYTSAGLSKNPSKDDEEQRYLLGPAEEEHEGFFSAPGSLREVEGEIHVYLRQEDLTP
jgi:hypothetical protein